MSARSASRSLPGHQGATQNATTNAAIDNRRRSSSSRLLIVDGACVRDVNFRDTKKTEEDETDEKRQRRRDRAVDLQDMCRASDQFCSARTIEIKH